jgi:hypothetical protein
LQPKSNLLPKNSVRYLFIMSVYVYFFTKDLIYCLVSFLDVCILYNEFKYIKLIVLQQYCKHCNVIGLIVLLTIVSVLDKTPVKKFPEK